LVCLIFYEGYFIKPLIKEVKRDGPVQTPFQTEKENGTYLYEG